jgi:hypothetical protein
MRTTATTVWVLSALIVNIVLLVALGVVGFTVPAWNPFSPQDYEDCAERAATKAKSKEALDVLISVCSSKFVSRRKPEGGYSYYDSRQNRHFDVAGPNPTPKEWKNIETEYSIYMTAKRQEQEDISEARRQAAVAQAKIEFDRQQTQLDLERRRQQFIAETERRRRAAISKIEVVFTSFECTYATMGCGVYKSTVKVKNSSWENITALGFGWEFVPMNETSSPDSFPTKKQEIVALRPGSTVVVNIDGYDGPNSAPARYCIKVSDAQIAPLQ